MLKIRLGIEKTMVGFFYLAAIIIFVLGYAKIEFGKVNDTLASLNKDVIPYISILLAGLAYLLGNIADRLTYTLLSLIWTVFNMIMMRIGNKKIKSLASSFGKEHDAVKYVIFLQNASPELTNEYMLELGQNILYRVIAFAMPLLGASSVYWMMRIRVEKSLIIAIVIFSIIATAMFILAYLGQRRKYFNFREEAFKELSKPIYRQVGINRLISQAGRSPSGDTSQDTKNK